MVCQLYILSLAEDFVVDRFQGTISDISFAISTRVNAINLITRHMHKTRKW